jgi:hypothetical protein
MLAMLFYAVASLARDRALMFSALVRHVTLGKPERTLSTQPAANGTLLGVRRFCSATVTQLLDV